MANAENQDLQDLFAVECHGHLAAMRAQLAPLAAGADTAASRAAAAALSDILHTLAGAARAVDLVDLEYLCRAVEGMLAEHPAQLDDARLALIDAVVDLAPQLLSPPSGRVRNQMMALASRCAAATAPAMAGANA